MGLHAEDHLQSLRPCAKCSRQLTAGIWNSCQRSKTRGTGRDKLDKLSRTVQQEGRSYPGFNLFDPDDDILLRSIARGEFNISGLQNKTLRRYLPDKTSGQVSRLLKRLRLHGIIKRVGHTYKYYLTQFGKHVTTAGLKLRELVLIPHLAGTPA